MSSMFNDQTKHWEPVDQQARLVIRPAKEDEKLIVRESCKRVEMSQEARRILCNQERMLRSGDYLGSLTVLGITRRMNVLCRCDCGRVDSFSFAQIIKAAIGRVSPKAKIRLCCNECLALRLRILKANE